MNLITKEMYFLFSFIVPFYIYFHLKSHEKQACLNYIRGLWFQWSRKQHFQKKNVYIHTTMKIKKP